MSKEEWMDKPKKKAYDNMAANELEKQGMSSSYSNRCLAAKFGLTFPVAFFFGHFKNLFSLFGQNFVIIQLVSMRRIRKVKKNYGPSSQRATKIKIYQKSNMVSQTGNCLIYCYVWK